LFFWFFFFILVSQMCQGCIFQDMENPIVEPKLFTGGDRGASLEAEDVE
jgi:hypothetical protein